MGAVAFSSCCNTSDTSAIESAADHTIQHKLSMMMDQTAEFECTTWSPDEEEKPKASADEALQRGDEKSSLPIAFGGSVEKNKTRNVIFEKARGSHVGFQLDAIDPEVLMVDSILDSGLAVEHNSLVSSAGEGHLIAEGDRILEVNGISATVEMQNMLEKASDQDQLKITFETCIVKQISLNKEHDLRTLNVDVYANPDSNYLAIKSIAEPGLAASWNAANPDRLIRAHEKIALVDGLSGTGLDLVKLIEAKDAFTLTFYSWQGL